MKRYLLLFIIFNLNANIIDGNTNPIGNPRDLSLNPIDVGILVDEFVTTSIKNHNLTNLSGTDRLRTFTACSQLVLENTTLDLDGTFTFTHGSIRIVGNCTINGSSDFNKFRFASHMIYITESSSLRIGPNVIFEYAPTSSILDGIRFFSPSSKLILEDATLTVSNTYGLNLIRGQLQIEGNSIVDNVYTDTSKALVLGYGPMSSGDCKLKITNGSKLTVKNAGIVYRNVGTSSLQGTGELEIDKKGSFLVEETVDVGNSNITLNASLLKSAVKKGDIQASPTFLDNDTSSIARAFGFHFGPDGKTLISAMRDNSTQDIRFYNFENKSMSAPYMTVSIPATWGSFDARAISNDMKYLSSADHNIGTLYYTDIVNQEVALQSLTEAWDNNTVYFAEISPDNRFVAYGGYGNVGGGSQALKIYSFNGTNLSATTVAGDTFIGATSDRCRGPLSFSPTGRYLMAGGFHHGQNLDQIRIYRFDDSTCTLNTISDVSDGDTDFNCASSGEVEGVSFSKDERFICATDPDNGDEDVRLYALIDNQVTKIATLGGFTSYEYANDARFSNNGKYLAICGNRSGSQDVRIYRFDGTSSTLDDDHIVASIDAGTPTNISFSPDDRYLSVSLDSGTRQFAVYELSYNDDSQKTTLFKDTTIKLSKDLKLTDVNLKMK